MIAHRGASARAPENTLSAVRAAVACGADAVEIDVRRSRDGEFVVLHDATLGRTTDVRRQRWNRSGPRVDELTLNQLRRLDAGSWKGPSFVGERIPTLDEVLDLVASTPARLLIEVKRPVGSDPRDLGDLAALLDAAPVPHRRITVQSFDCRVAQDLRNRLPGITLAVLTRSVHGDLRAYSRWADQVSLHHKSLDRRTLDAVKGWGMHCVTWTVNSPVSMRRVLGLGVDGVITDHPEAVLALLNGRRSASEALSAHELPQG
ncbi:MAG: glycerophosphodiester phosphodiesterase [Nocardioides sp.]